MAADSSADPLAALDAVIRQAAVLTRTAREQDRAETTPSTVRELMRLALRQPVPAAAVVLYLSFAVSARLSLAGVPPLAPASNDPNITHRVNTHVVIQTATPVSKLDF